MAPLTSSNAKRTGCDYRKQYFFHFATVLLIISGSSRDADLQTHCSLGLQRKAVGPGLSPADKHIRQKEMLAMLLLPVSCLRKHQIKISLMQLCLLVFQNEIPVTQAEGGVTSPK